MIMLLFFCILCQGKTEKELSDTLVSYLQNYQIRKAEHIISVFDATVPKEVAIDFLTNFVQNNERMGYMLMIDYLISGISKELASDFLLIFLERDDYEASLGMILKGATINEKNLKKYLIRYTKQNRDQYIRMLIYHFSNHITLEIAQELLPLIIHNDNFYRVGTQFLPIFVENNQINHIRLLIMLGVKVFDDIGYKLLPILIKNNQTECIDKLFDSDIYIYPKLASKLLPMFAKNNQTKYVQKMIEYGAVIHDEL